MGMDITGHTTHVRHRLEAQCGTLDAQCGTLRGQGSGRDAPG